MVSMNLKIDKFMAVSIWRVVGQIGLVSTTLQIKNILTFSIFGFTGTTYIHFKALFIIYLSIIALFVKKHFYGFK